MAKTTTKNALKLQRRQAAPLDTPTDLKADATRDISAAMNGIMSGPHFRDYHLMLDDQATQLFEMTDPIAERVRKLGGTTLRSIGNISRTQRVLDNDANYVQPLDMLAELRDDNKGLVSSLREAHGVCDEHGDIATASLIEVWIDETERRTWFLFEASRSGDPTGH